MSRSPDDLLEALQKVEKDASGLPPVHGWHPELSGDIDIRILSDGTWLHEGEPMVRLELVRLFSTILRREGDEYFLVTPVEKWRLQVEDAPFTAPLVDRHGAGEGQSLVFTTNVGAAVLLDAGHPLRVETAPGGEPAPYLMVRDGLEARVGRNAFYQLVEWAREQGGELLLRSSGCEFSLGSLD